MSFLEQLHAFFSGFSFSYTLENTSSAGKVWYAVAPALDTIIGAQIIMCQNVPSLICCGSVNQPSLGDHTEQDVVITCDEIQGETDYIVVAVLSSDEDGDSYEESSVISSGFYSGDVEKSIINADMSSTELTFSYTLENINSGT